MSAETAQLGKHAHLGIDCAWCGALADVVATWQLPASKGNPFGSYRHVPLCNACGVRALNEPRAPRVTEHEEAVRRREKRQADERAARRAEFAAAQLDMGW